MILRFYDFAFKRLKKRLLDSMILAERRIYIVRSVCGLTLLDEEYTLCVACLWPYADNRDISIVFWALCSFGRNSLRRSDNRDIIA